MSDTFCPLWLEGSDWATVFKHRQMYTDTNTGTHMHAHLHTNTHIYTHTHAHKHAHTRTHTHAHKRAHAHKHAHTHTHSLSLNVSHWSFLLLCNLPAAICKGLLVGMDCDQHAEFGIHVIKDSRKNFALLCA